MWLRPAGASRPAAAGARGAAFLAQSAVLAAPSAASAASSCKPPANQVEGSGRHRFVVNPSAPAAATASRSWARGARSGAARAVSLLRGVALVRHVQQATARFGGVAICGTLGAPEARLPGGVAAARGGTCAVCSGGSLGGARAGGGARVPVVQGVEGSERWQAQWDKVCGTAGGAWVSWCVAGGGQETATAA